MSKQPMKQRIVIDLSGRYFMNTYVNYIMKGLLNVGLILFLMTSIDMATYSAWLDIIIFAMIFTVTEEALGNYIHQRFGKYIFMSFGTVMILPVIFSMSVAYYIVTSMIMFRSMDTFFGFIVAFMILRKLVSIVLIAHLNRRRFERLIEKEVNKDV